MGISRSIATVLLAATMLAWHLSPPSVEHAHQVGSDLSHHHGHTLRGDAAGKCESDHSPEGASPAISGERSHRHVEWLGLHLTCSDDESPARKGENREASKLLFVHAGRVSAPHSSASSDFDELLMIAHCDATMMDAAASCSGPSGFLSQVETVPLCDLARRERSGVQLS